jgi:hypothetical protein
MAFKKENPKKRDSVKRQKWEKANIKQKSKVKGISFTLLL